MPQIIMPDTYLRLDASSYHGANFFKQEERMAESFGMSYQAIHFSKQGLASFPNIPPQAKICLATNTHTPIELLPAQLLKQTTILLHANSGYDNFPPKWVQNQSFPIVVGNKIRAQAVTQYILTELLSYFNHIPSHQNWDSTRKWDRKLLDQQKILILGNGAIGSKLKASLFPLAKSITIYDPFQNKNFDLNSRLNEFDIVIFACSLNESSYHLLNQKNIKFLKEDVFLINAARGPLIAEKPLLRFLMKNSHAYAVLDVFEEEPFATQFHELENIKTTSHIAGVSCDLDQRIITFAEISLEKFKRGEELSPLLQERYIDDQAKGILI